MLNQVYSDGVLIQMNEHRIDHMLTMHVTTMRVCEDVQNRAIIIHTGDARDGAKSVLEAGRWLLSQDLFDEVILPDRVGCGNSAMPQRAESTWNEAQDIQRLMNIMDVRGHVSVIGVGDGGLVALKLAYIDPRVKRVGLVASSPRVKSNDWLRGLLERAGLVYDEKSRRLPDEVALDLPIFQVVGAEDEVWAHELPQSYEKRFPNMRQMIVGGASQENFKAHESEYYIVLASLMHGIPTA